MALHRPGLILQNEPDAPGPVLEAWLRARAIPFAVHRAWLDPLPADPTAFAFLAPLGSEHSAAATEPAWVPEEIGLLRRAIEADVPVLGLCFGGQALAVVLGGEIGPADPPEVGWMEVETHDPQRVPAGPWLQFHFETFTVPPGARALAATPTGPAAFAHGPHLGLQFHPEVTPAVVDGWVAGEPRLPGLGVAREALLEQGRRAAPAAAANARRLLDAWWAVAGGVRAG